MKQNVAGFKATFLLLLTALAFSASAQTTLVSTGAVWKYLDDGSDQGTAWRDWGFDDSIWPSGAAELGFGDGDEVTTNVAGNVTYYYRHTFNVPSASTYTNLRVALERDDGAIVYLNGVEVFRSNMPTGAVSFGDFAVGNAVEDVFVYQSFSPSALSNGNNVIAVEVHQSGLTSSDVSFNLALEGNPLPFINIASPTNGQTIVAEALAVAGAGVPGGSNVTLIEIFQGTTKIGQSTTADYNIAWTNVAPGNYALRAKITDSAGLVATSAPVNITVQAVPESVLISLGSRWKYLDNGSDQGTAWRAPSFDDSSWEEGPAEIGYGDGGEATIVGCKPGCDPCITGAGNCGDGAVGFPKWATTYFRKKFVVSNPAAYSSLTIETIYDDGCVIYINGNEVRRVRINDDVIVNFDTYIGAGADYTPDIGTISASFLQAGTNTIAVEMHQSDNASSDISFDMRLEGQVDTTAPTLAGIEPPPGTRQLTLAEIEVLFSEPVTGVDVSDLLINNDPATGFDGTGAPQQYRFSFPQPPTGTVQFAFAPTHGITDLSPSANPFAGSNWVVILDTNVPARANFILSEFMANNDTGIRDEDGDRSDWVEILNLGPLDSSIEGWFLTDEATNLTKWRFPNKVVAQNQYLLVFASGKDKTNPAAPFLHTSFNLSPSGEYLALVDPNTNIISAFSTFPNNYPPQTPDVSYGRDRTDTNIVGYYTNATPGAQNAISGSGIAAAADISPPSGVYTNDSIVVTMTVPPGTTVRYTVNGTLPTATSLQYTAPLTISTNVILKARAFSSTPGVFPGAVVSRSFLFLDATSRNFNSKLPIIIMSTEGRAIQSGVTRTLGSAVFIDTVQGRASISGVPDFIGPAAMETFGQTSEGFPKQPHNIELQDALGNDLNASVLGLPADGDWKLRNPYSDKCLMNDFLAHELWEEMGHYSLRRRQVEVFRDTGGGKIVYPGDYYGVLTLLEKIEIDENRVDLAQLTPANTNEASGISGGYIFKHDKVVTTGPADLVFYASSRMSALGLKLHEPKPREVNNSHAHPQVRWISNYVRHMESVLYGANWTNATGTNHYSHYLDLDSFADHQLHVELSKQIDGYRLSGYFSKDRNGKIAMSPLWDWNLSFGNADYLEGGRTNGWYYSLLGEPDHIWLRRLISDPDFSQRVADRWSVFRTNALNGDRINTRIQEIANLMDEAAVRNFAKYPTLGTYLWPNPPGNPANQANWHVNFWVGINSYSQIISNMKYWVKGRYDWMDAQFTRRPEMNLSGGQVPAGTQVTLSVPQGTTVYYTIDGTDPRAPGGGIRPGALTYSTAITVNNNVRIFARAKTPTGAWSNTWSGPIEATFFINVPALRITEVMYHPHDPPPPTPYLDEDFEYIEVKNTGVSTLNLNRFSISGGIDFNFPSYNLASGGYAVIVANSNAFRNRYGPAIPVIGSWNTPNGTNRLDNGGERIVLQGPVREPIHDFRYSDEWYPITDGHGFSLVIRDENDNPSNWVHAASWRPSGQLGGSPGGPDTASTFPNVVINEVVTGTSDSIELRNLDAAPANIGGWYLTDDFGSPKKYTIPATTIPGNGFVTFSQGQFGSAFTLSHLGGEVYLFSGAGGNLTGYENGFDFGALPQGSSFGRYVISTGDDQFPIQSATTLGSANAYPLVGPVVISEINYHPIDIFVEGVGYNDTEKEYIELHNSSGALARLYDPTRPTNTWRLNDAVEFTFPTNTSIPAGGYLVVVGFNPTNLQKLAAFTNANPVPPGTQILGPWDGALDNAGDRVELRRPGTPEPDGFVPSILVERVSYDNEAPWPAGADGIGPALQRISVTGYGNDPTNWTAAGRSPGAPFGGGAPPTITSNPTNVTVVAGETAQFRVQASGAPPLSYQWRRNGQPLNGATAATLTLADVQTSQAGTYDCVVLNPSGSAVSVGAVLTVLVPIIISEQPADITLGGRTNSANYGQSGVDAIFRVVATSQNPPVNYRWYRDGNLIPGANSSTYVINQATTDDEGVYSVEVSDQISNRRSRDAGLYIHIRPFFTGEPYPESQFLRVGQPYSLSVGARGHPMPLNYVFRRGSTNYQIVSTNSFVGTLRLPAVQLLDAATYSASVSNSYPIVASTNSTLSISRLAYLVVVDPHTNQIVSIGTTVTNRANVRSSVSSSLRYQWFKDGVLIPGATTTNLVVTNLQSADAGIYTLAITNNAVTNLTPRYPEPIVGYFDALISTPQTDTDGDGMPDWFEQQYNVSNPNDDSDGDGIKNIDEYRSGTNPIDANSYLRIDISPDVGGVLLEFMAVSNRSYSLLVRGVAEGAPWQQLQDFGLRTTNRLERYIDAADGEQRYYRLTTPRSP